MIGILIQGVSDGNMFAIVFSAILLLTAISLSRVILRAVISNVRFWANKIIDTMFKSFVVVYTTLTGEVADLKGEE